MHSISYNKILNRESCKQEVKTILSAFSANIKNLSYKKGIYIYGSPGCGKTVFVQEILKELNYDVVKYDAGDVRNKSLIDTITSNNIASQNVLSMMQGKPKHIAIIMDEIDGMNNGDKGGITALIKIIRQKKTKKQRLENMTYNPIICIGNYYIDKKIKELMKVCYTFELNTPSDTQITNIMLYSIPITTYSPTMQQKILDYIQGDLRKLEFIQKIYITNPALLNEETVDSVLQVKSYNNDAKKITQNLMNQNIPIGQHTRFINETDRTIVALLWHENIVDMLAKTDQKNAIPFYIRILDNICFADYIDRITFQYQIWSFNEMSFLMKTFYNNKLYRETFPELTHTDEVRFTKVLTKYSTEYNNVLFIYNLCKQLDMDKKDLIALFYELQLYYGKEFYNNSERLGHIEKLFENYSISKLDIKRMYRYLEKNVKKDALVEEDELSDCGGEEEL
jgi:DNA polymerase III delta prime subunit